MSNDDRDQIQARLIQKAIKDEQFRARLIADPKAVIAEDMGGELPSGTKVTVLQESADHFYLVLPPSGTGELSESDLDGVHGGVAKKWTAEKKDEKKDEKKRPNGCSGFCMGTTTAAPE